MTSTPLDMIPRKQQCGGPSPVRRQPAAQLSDFHDPSGHVASCERGRSVFLLVLERKLQLGPEDDLALGCDSLSWPHRDSLKWLHMDGASMAL